MKDRRTLFAVKISTDRNTRQFWQFLGIFALLLLVVAGVAIGQVLLCHRDHPGQTVMECLKK